MKRLNMKNKKVASAIGYSPEDTAPRLLATGKGQTAENIIATALESGVAIVEDPALAALLNASVLPGELVPFWCWEAIAKILVFVQRE